MGKDTYLLETKKLVGEELARVFGPILGPTGHRALVSIPGKPYATSDGVRVAMSYVPPREWEQAQGVLMKAAIEGIQWIALNIGDGTSSTGYLTGRLLERLASLVEEYADSPDAIPHHIATIYHQAEALLADVERMLAAHSHNVNLADADERRAYARAVLMNALRGNADLIPFLEDIDPRGATFIRKGYVPAGLRKGGAPVAKMTYRGVFIPAIHNAGMRRVVDTPARLVVMLSDEYANSARAISQALDKLGITQVDKKNAPVVVIAPTSHLPRQERELLAKAGIYVVGVQAKESDLPYGYILNRWMAALCPACANGGDGKRRDNEQAAGRQQAAATPPCGEHALTSHWVTFGDAKAHVGSRCEATTENARFFFVNGGVFIQLGAWERWEALRDTLAKELLPDESTALSEQERVVVKDRLTKLSGIITEIVVDENSLTADAIMQLLEDGVTLLRTFFEHPRVLPGGIAYCLLAQWLQTGGSREDAAKTILRRALGEASASLCRRVYQNFGLDAPVVSGLGMEQSQTLSAGAHAHAAEATRQDIVGDKHAAVGTSRVIRFDEQDATFRAETVPLSRAGSMADLTYTIQSVVRQAVQTAVSLLGVYLIIDEPSSFWGKQDPANRE